MTRKQHSLTGPGRAILGALALVVFFAFGAPQAAQASTSANATIFNQVTVSYTSGSNTLTAQADVSVTVATLAAKPTVYVDTTAQTTTAGGVVTYTYTVRSNSNGPDTYTTAAPDSVDANISASSETTPAAVTLWGGIVLSSGAGFITLPGGSTTGLANGDTVELTVGGATHRYTVTITTAGNGASAGTAEVLAEVALAPVTSGTDPAITAGNVTVGTQVGQYTTNTMVQTAGTPTTAGTDGTHTTNLTLTTTETDATNAVVTYTTSTGDSNQVITTVSSPKVTITKTADVTNAKPGETITYTVTVTNTHASAAASSVTVTDAVPAYTTMVVTGGNFATATLNGGTPVTITTAADAENANVVSGSLVGSTIQFNLGAGQDGSATPAVGGTLAHGDVVVITYKVTVD